jgi:inositol oxygenase
MKQSNHAYRNYTDSDKQVKVAETYRLNHTLQTYEHVQQMKKEHLLYNKGKMSIWEAISKLDQLVDDSDPDADFPQIFHALQTAEALRKHHPEADWLPLVGLIHDLGKILALPEFGGLPQWNVVGDTFPVGCPHSQDIVMSHFFDHNPDSTNPLYNTGTGIYTKNCGLDALQMSWGHDEYMYQVCLRNKSTLPPAALKVIRFHSFYPWHNKLAYQEYMDDSDREYLSWVQRFQKADLYSKVPDLPDVETLKPHYISLINKYFPNPVLEW